MWGHLEYKTNYLAAVFESPLREELIYLVGYRTHAWGHLEYTRQRNGIRDTEIWANALRHGTHSDRYVCVRLISSPR